MTSSLVIKFQYLILASAMLMILWSLYQDGYAFSTEFWKNLIFPALMIVISVGVIAEYRKRNKNENRRI